MKTTLWVNEGVKMRVEMFERTSSIVTVCAGLICFVGGGVVVCDDDDDW
jgi:hypothetical protein